MGKKDVIKSSWVIHISHQLTLLQQQIWNVLLAYAYDNLSKQDTHYLDIRVLTSYLQKKHSLKDLKGILQQLCETESVNLINKNKNVTAKHTFSLLANAAIEDGFCKYAFGPDLIPQLVNPPSYAKINLLTQAKFKSKYALIIYELCVDYAGIERTPAFTIDELKTYLGLDVTKYSLIKHFNYKIIKKVIAEVNQKSDLLIAVKFDTKNGKPSVWFAIKKKERTVIDLQKMITRAAKKEKAKTATQCPFFTQLKEHGVSHQKALNIINFFSPHEIQNAFDSMQRNLEKIKNPAAYLAQIFTKKSTGAKPMKVMGANKCKEFSYENHDLRVAHKQFVDNRLKELWRAMPDDRKQTLLVAFEKWMAQQDFNFTFTGSDSIYRYSFLSEVLLSYEERNFESWARKREE